MQLDALWHFMEVDMAADKFESDMRQSENRKKLIKSKNTLIELQASMKELEENLAEMQDRVDAVQDEAERLEKELAKLSESMENEPASTQEQAEENMAQLDKLIKAISRYEQELRATQKDLEAKNRKQKEIRLQAPKTKSEYDKLKVVYDAEFKEQKLKLASMRKDIETVAKGVDPALLKRYYAIKQHATPPMARLVNGQCTGCFMSLPSATMLAIEQGNSIVECDNCGRILYVKP